MLNKIISVLLIFIFFCFPFLKTNANYSKEIKLTKKEVINIEKVFEEYSKNNYSTRGVKTWVTREGVENIANGLRSLQHSRIARWVADKLFTKKDGERLFENMRYLAYKFDDLAASMDYFTDESIDIIAKTLYRAGIPRVASERIAGVLVDIFL